MGTPAKRTETRKSDHESARETGDQGARGFSLPPCEISGKLPFGPKKGRFPEISQFLGQMGGPQKPRMAGDENLEHQKGLWSPANCKECCPRASSWSKSYPRGS